MAFMQNNGFGNNMNNGGGNGERKSFPIGRIYAADGQIDCGIYKSNSATWISISGKKSIGTNPSTNSMAIEQTQPQQLPSVLLSTETARAFLDAAVDVDPSTLNFTINAGGTSHATLTVAGSMSDVKVTFKSDRGERCISLAAIPIGSRNSFASWENLIEFVKTGYKKAMIHKLNPDEFAAEINGTSSSSSDDDSPFA